MMSKKMKWIIPVAIILLIILIYAVILSMNNDKEASLNPEEVSEENISQELFTSVTMGEVESKSFVDDRQFSGTTESNEFRDIIAEVSGKIKKINYDVGDAVKKNDTIAIIDSEQYQLILDKAEVGVSSSKLAYEMEQSNFDRSQTLYEAESISEVTYEMAEFALKQAANSYELALTDRENAKLNLRNTFIKAGQDGVLSVKMINEGEIISQGMAVASIVNLSELIVNISVPEETVVDIDKGDSAKISIQSLGLDDITGEIESISPVPNSSNTYDVKILFHNQYDVLPGMRTEVSISLNKKLEGSAIQQKGVIYNQGAYYVWTNDNGKAKKHEIKIVEKIEGYYLIDPDSGFNLGDQIIVEGNAYLDVGDQVKVVNE